MALAGLSLACGTILASPIHGAADGRAADGRAAAGGAAMAQALPADPTGVPTFDAPTSEAPASSTAAPPAVAYERPGPASMPAQAVVPQPSRGFVVLGDSLSAWAFDPKCRRPSSAGTWPSVLASLDSQLNLLHNGGVPGNTTSQMAARFRSEVLAYQPDLLVVLGGTNDIAGYVPVSKTVTNLRAIVRAAKSRGIDVILLTVPPNNRLYWVGRARLRMLNEAIADLGADEGIAVADVYSALANAEGLLPRAYAAADRVHLTKSAEAVIAETVYAAMHPAIPLLP